MKIPTKVPKWLYDNFGGHYGEYAQSKNAWGSGIIAKWSIHGVEAQEFIHLIKPYLIDKAELAELALVFPVAKSSHKGVQEIEIQEVVYNRMRLLQNKNKRRPGHVILDEFANYPEQMVVPELIPV